MDSQAASHHRPTIVGGINAFYVHLLLVVVINSKMCTYNGKLYAFSFEKLPVRNEHTIFHYLVCGRREVDIRLPSQPANATMLA